MKNKINEANNYNCVLCETGEGDKHGALCSCNKKLKVELYWDDGHITETFETDADEETIKNLIKEIRKLEEYSTDDLMDALKNKGYSWRSLDTDISINF